MLREKEKLGLPTIKPIEQHENHVDISVMLGTGLNKYFDELKYLHFIFSVWQPKISKLENLK